MSGVFVDRSVKMRKRRWRSTSSTYYRSFGRSYDRDVVGFYTDSSGRVRPITRKGSGKRDPYLRLILQRPPPSSIKTAITVGRPMLEYALSALSSSVPFVGQISTTIQVAKLICDYCDTIKEASNAYERDGWAGVTKVAGREVAATYLSSAQARMIWSIIQPKIPTEYSKTAGRIVELAADKLTQSEIDYVDRWLSQHR